nr:MAG TPA: hypothetical protein [Caudoviricetes sp.]
MPGLFPWHGGGRPAGGQPVNQFPYLRRPLGRPCGGQRPGFRPFRLSAGPSGSTPERRTTARFPYRFSCGGARTSLRL